MRSLFVLRSLVAGGFVLAVFLSVGVAGCTDKACIRWTVEDRDGGVGATSGAGGAGGAAGGGGAGGSGGAADAGAMPEMDGGTDGGPDGGTDGGTGEVECPLLPEALKRLGQPSCVEKITSIEWLDPNKKQYGAYDPGTGQCCYAVTTETKPCGDGGT